MQQSSFIEPKVAATWQSKAPNDQSNNANQHKAAEPIGQRVVGSTRQSSRRDGERKISFNSIDKIHQPVEDEAIKNEGVKDANGRTLLEGAPLGQRRDHGIPKPPGKLIEARLGIRPSS